MTCARKVYLVFLLLFLSVLSISDTIALRNLLHVAMLGISVWLVLTSWDSSFPALKKTLARVPMQLYWWIGFLMLFPLWSGNSSVAWEGFIRQWGVDILTWALALCAVVVFRERLSLWVLAVVSAFPVFLHLALTGLAWCGLLTQEFKVDPSLGALWGVVQGIYDDPEYLLQFKWGGFPWGFRGVEPMHGNIGYSACQAIVLATASGFGAWQSRNSRGVFWSLGLIGLCLFSVVVAASRGAAYYGVLMLLLGFAAYLLVARTKRTVESSQRKRRSLGVALVSITLILVLAVASKLRHEERWYSMWDSAAIGWTISDPTRVLCEGPTDAQLQEIKSKYSDRDPVYLAGLITPLSGDIGRVLMMRAGLNLVLEHPLGGDGTRQTYEKLMHAKCAHIPTFNFAHAHQAWVNLSLSFGIAGGVLYALVLYAFGAYGWRLLSADFYSPHGMALLLLAIFWGLRGLSDAVFQDHYMQMQAFYLLYIYLSLDNVKIAKKKR